MFASASGSARWHERTVRGLLGPASAGWMIAHTASDSSTVAVDRRAVGAARLAMGQWRKEQLISWRSCRF